MKMIRSPLVKVVLLLLFVVFHALIASLAPAAQTEEIACTRKNIAACYKRAKQFYFNKDFEAAKVLFEKITAANATYKKASIYLEKCLAYVDSQGPAPIMDKSPIGEQTEEQTKAQIQKPSDSVNSSSLLRAQAKPGLDEEEFPPAKEAPQEAAEYRIGVGDVLDISVWRNQDLDKSVIVRPDGLISYPLVGDVPAAGSTLTELDKRLTGILREYVKIPEVSVAVARFGGTKVILLGEVKGPGVYNIQGKVNLIDVIAQSGGFTKDAVKHSTLVIRGGLGHPEIYRLNAARIFKGDFSQNIPIASNDIIYVPKRFLANLNDAVAYITPILSNTLLGTSVYRDLKDILK